MKEFECGCKIENLNHETINFDCPVTWDIFEKGLTKGVFQLERPLGKSWSKKLRPQSIEEIASLISLIRPGCLNSGMTEKFYKVKWGEEPASYIHPDIQDILSQTHSGLIYQEQCMEIAKVMCGFTLSEADTMRKAIGKKLEDLMATIKPKFIDGGLNNGYEKEIMEEIWSWIVEFAEYGFNKSHAVSYAYLSYATAYYKAHFPKEFFNSLLRFSKHEQKPLEEIRDIEIEARLWDIYIQKPNIKYANMHFELDDNGNIRFGLSHIKQIGISATEKLQNYMEVESFREFFGVFTHHKLNKLAVQNLIKCGALDELTPEINRNDKLNLFELFVTLKQDEREGMVNWSGDVISYVKNLSLRYSLDNRRKRRATSLEEALKKYYSSPSECPPAQIIGYERSLLGISPSGSLVDYKSQEKVSHRCIDLLTLNDKTPVTLGIVLESFRKYKSPKNNKEMVFMTVSDSSHTLDSCVMFEENMNLYWDSLYEGATLILKGKKSRNSMIVEEVIDL